MATPRVALVTGAGRGRGRAGGRAGAARAVVALTRTLAAITVCVPMLAACSGGGDGGERQSSSAVAGDPELASTAADAVSDHGLPALAIARISGDGSVRIGIAGIRSHGSDDALGVDAPFHLGSNAKAMTAMLLATFVDEGRLDLDDRLAELLPDLTLDAGLDAATVRDVLGHRAGLDDRTLDMAALFRASDHAAARVDAVRDALRRPGIDGGTYSYANVSYMVAGVIAERLGGSSWERLLVDRVLAPLGSTCGFGAPTGAAVPLGHTAAGEPVPEDAAVTDNPPALGPAGTVHCTMSDWARFVSAVLAGAAGRDSPVLGADTAADLFGDDHAYVAGWSRRLRDGATILSHDGSNTFWYARAVLVVERGEALLLASNTGEPGAVVAMNELTAAFLDR